MGLPDGSSAPTATSVILPGGALTTSGSMKGR
jgi:hypothetical protein